MPPPPPIWPGEVLDDLPTGRLTQILANRIDALFVSLDDIVSAGPSREFTFFVVHSRPRNVYDTPATQEVGRGRIDCAARTYQQVRLRAFDAKGEEAYHWGARAASPIGPQTPAFYLAAQVCAGTTGSNGQTVNGHIAAVALAERVFATNHARTSEPPPPAYVAAITLPKGPLRAIAANTHAVFFVALDGLNRTGSAVEYTGYIVYRNPLTPHGIVAVQEVQRARIDCVAHDFLLLGAQSFDEDGRLAVWLPQDTISEAIETGSARDWISDFVCGRATHTREMIVAGHAAALDFGKRALGGIEPEPATP